MAAEGREWLEMSGSVCKRNKLCLQKQRSPKRQSPIVHASKIAVQVRNASSTFRQQGEGFASEGRLRKLNVGTLSANTEGLVLLPSTSVLDKSARDWIPSVSPPPCEFESRFLILSSLSTYKQAFPLIRDMFFSPCSFQHLYLSVSTHPLSPTHHGFFCSHLFWPFHSHAILSPSLYPQSGNVLDEHFQTLCLPAPA